MAFPLYRRLRNLIDVGDIANGQTLVWDDDSRVFSGAALGDPGSAAHVADAALDGGPHGLPALTANGMGWRREAGALVATSIATTAEVAAETSARAAADTVLTQDLDAEETTRAGADVGLASDIGDEETARIAGDAAVADALADEVTARAAADAGLAANIAAAEASAARYAFTMEARPGWWGTAAAGQVAATLVRERAVLGPYHGAPSDASIDRLQVEVTTAPTTGTIKLALYGPDLLLHTVFDTKSISSPTTVVEWVVDMVLPGGLVWFGAIVAGTSNPLLRLVGFTMPGPMPGPGHALSANKTSIGVDGVTDFPADANGMDVLPVFPVRVAVRYA